MAVTFDPDAVEFLRAQEIARRRRAGRTRDQALAYARAAMHTSDAELVVAYLTIAASLGATPDHLKETR